MPQQSNIVQLHPSSPSAAEDADINDVQIKDLVERVTRLEQSKDAFENIIESIKHKDDSTNLLENKVFSTLNNYLKRQELFKELDELLLLEQNWDGHNALPISKIPHSQAYKFLNSIGQKAAFFEPFPLPNGGIGLEIHIEKDYELLLSFSPESEIAYVVALNTEVHRGRGIKDISNNMPSAMAKFLNELEY